MQGERGDVDAMSGLSVKQVGAAITWKAEAAGMGAEAVKHVVNASHCSMIVTNFSSNLPHADSCTLADFKKLTLRGSPRFVFSLLRRGSAPGKSGARWSLGMTLQILLLCPFP